MRISRRELLGASVAAALPRRRRRACVIGHTGRGNYGHGLDLCFQRIPGVTVAAVADPDEKGRAAAARRIGVERAYADWREMLKKEKPDVLSVGPRWVEHRVEMLTAAAEIGAHVYMEKPVALNLEEADRIVAAADKHGTKIAVALQSLLAPALLHVREQLRNGVIGDFLEMRTRGKEDRRAGGEDMMVLGTHCMYHMRFFAGPASWCSARVTQEGRDITRKDRRPATEPLGPVAGDTIHASYAFGEGIQGHFASQKIRGNAKGPGGRRPFGRFQITLYGSTGVLHLPISQDPKAWLLRDPLWAPGRTGSKWEPLPDAPDNRDPSGLSGTAAANKRIVEDLLRAADEGRNPVAGIREGRAALEMIHAVYASHLSGARAALPLKDRAHPLGNL